MKTGELKISLHTPWQGRGYSEVQNESTAYQKVPLIYRAVRLRCNSLARVPVYVYGKRGKVLPEYEFEGSLPLQSLIWMSEAAILLQGASFILKVNNQYGFTRELQWLNPFTMQSNYTHGRLEFWQQLNDRRFPKSGNWTLDDFVFLKEFHPDDDLGPGVSATSVALGDGKILSSATNFLGNFFSADALPVTMVIAKSMGRGEADRVENWFKDKLCGMRNAISRVIGLSGEDVRVEKLTSELQTFDFEKVDNHAIRDIAWAFDIPKTLLTADSANYATANIERRVFTEGTIVPRCKYYENVLNKFLEPFGQRIGFAPEELPEMQEDENLRATAVKYLVESGTPLRAAFDILGYVLSDEAEKLLDDAEKKALPLGVDQVNQVNKVAVSPPADQMKTSVLSSDLDKWMRKSLKALKNGKSASVEFQSDSIPPELALKITGRLDNFAGLSHGGEAKSEDGIKNIFKEVQYA